MTCPFCHSKKTSFFALKDKFRFQRCLICKSLFIKNVPSKKLLNRYYERQFKYSDGHINESVIRTRSKQILRRIRRKYPMAKTICDVGSGCGFFLDEANKQGYKVLGIEPSKELAYTASTAYNIPQFVGPLESYIKIHNIQFDVVTCIHVIEHVVKPREFICSLLQLVKAEGILFLETPNGDSHLVDFEKDRYTFLIPPEHLWIFSKDAIQKLLPGNSRIISINTYSYSEHFMGIIKRKMFPNKNINIKLNNQINKSANIQKVSFKKKLSYLLFDKLLAQLLTPLLNTYHKGSILELYISKK